MTDLNGSYPNIDGLLMSSVVNKIPPSLEESVTQLDQTTPTIIPSPSMVMEANRSIISINDRRNAVQTLAGKIFSVKTSSGKFRYVSQVHYERMSDHLLKVVCDQYNQGAFKNNEASMYFMGDHSTYEYIDRYIQYGIKINLISLCAGLGISGPDALRLIKDWGYDESICY